MTRLSNKDARKILGALDDAAAFFSNFSENQSDDRRRLRLLRAGKTLAIAMGYQIDRAPKTTRK